PFSFSGSGREYFGIWIVNLLLSIVTLGIYSAWAKVRRTRYFYNNTQVAGASFDYHGNPIAILKGRFVALMLIIMYNLAMRESGVIAVLMLIAVAFASPWLIWKSLQFKLYNSSYRGIRFGFRGTLGAVYKVYLLFPLLSAVTLFLLAPFAHQRLKKFQHEESRFGVTHFSFGASAGKFYKVYLVAFLVWLAGVMAISVVLGGGLGALGALKNPKANLTVLSGLLTWLFALYVWLFLLFPIFNTMVQNLIWNHTQLGPHHFRCEMKWTRVVFIALTNILGVICTLGLFTPFAQIRMLRYRVSSMTLLPQGTLDEFVAATQAETSATGEGVADLLDFDLSL
ncbi:MAG TPA: YjgN family protein, partial [Oxalicibacterium sp.]|nr:YjgN family protein [Oxalicibacterium sp.]